MVKVVVVELCAAGAVVVMNFDVVKGMVMDA